MTKTKILMLAGAFLVVAGVAAYADPRLGAPVEGTGEPGRPRGQVLSVQPPIVDGGSGAMPVELYPNNQACTAWYDAGACAAKDGGPLGTPSNAMTVTGTATSTPATGTIWRVATPDGGALSVQPRDWGAWTIVDSQVTNIYGDGGTVSQSPTPAGCEDWICRTGDVCIKLETTATYAPPTTCTLAQIESAALGDLLQSSPTCSPHPSKAATTTADAGSSDASVYSLKSVVGTPSLTIKRRCLK